MDVMKKESLSKFQQVRALLGVAWGCTSELLGEACPKGVGPGGARGEQLKIILPCAKERFVRKNCKKELVYSQ